MKIYSIEDVEDFIVAFLEWVVRRPFVLVAESVTAAALGASKRSNLVSRLVLLSPTGIATLSYRPTEVQRELFERLWADESAATEFYRGLLHPGSVGRYLERAYHDDSLVTDQRILEARLGGSEARLLARAELRRRTHLSRVRRLRAGSERPDTRRFQKKRRSHRGDGHREG